MRRQAIGAAVMKSDVSGNVGSVANLESSTWSDKPIGKKAICFINSHRCRIVELSCERIVQYDFAYIIVISIQIHKFKITTFLPQRSWQRQLSTHVNLAGQLISQSGGRRLCAEEPTARYSGRIQRVHSQLQGQLAVCRTALRFCIFYMSRLMALNALEKTCHISAVFLKTSTNS